MKTYLLIFFFLPVFARAQLSTKQKTQVDALIASTVKTLTSANTAQDKLIQTLFDKNTSQDRVHVDIIAANTAQDKLITSQWASIKKLVADTIFKSTQIKNLIALNKSLIDSVNQLSAKNISLENIIANVQSHGQATDALLGQVNVMVLNAVTKDSLITIIGTPGRIKIKTITPRIFQLDIDSTYKYN